MIVSTRRLWLVVELRRFMEISHSIQQDLANNSRTIHELKAKELMMNF